MAAGNPKPLKLVKDEPEAGPLSCEDQIIELEAQARQHFADMEGLKAQYHAELFDLTKRLLHCNDRVTLQDITNSLMKKLV